MMGAMVMVGCGGGGAIGEVVRGAVFCGGSLK